MEKAGIFTFTPENLKLVAKNIAKYPKGKEVSAIKALLDLAQRQNGGGFQSRPWIISLIICMSQLSVCMKLQPFILCSILSRLESF
jgi:hypothetical protein